MSVALASILFLQAAQPAIPPSRPPASNADLPAWSRTPSAAEMAAAYPPEAAKANLAGSATVECTVGPAGELIACTVAGESPTQAGFGAAALALAPKFQMPAKSPSGAAMAGRTVRFPLRWLNPARTQAPAIVVYDDAKRNGRVAFNCRVRPDRNLDNCVVVDARPQGTNLFAVAGEAALRQKAPTKAAVGERLLVVVEVQAN